MAVQRKYVRSEKRVRDWRKQMANRGCKARWMNLEDKLEEHVLTQRAACRGLHTVQLKLQAEQITTDLGVESFSGDPS